MQGDGSLYETEVRPYVPAVSAYTVQYGLACFVGYSLQGLDVQLFQVGWRLYLLYIHCCDFISWCKVTFFLLQCYTRSPENATFPTSYGNTLSGQGSPEKTSRLDRIARKVCHVLIRLQIPDFPTGRDGRSQASGIMFPSTGTSVPDRLEPVSPAAGCRSFSGVFRLCHLCLWPVDKIKMLCGTGKGGVDPVDVVGR